jgi:hypothetical protein
MFQEYWRTRVLALALAGVWDLVCCSSVLCPVLPGSALHCTCTVR